MGARMYKRLTSAVVRDGGARARFYRLSMVIEWSWVLVVGLILLTGGLPLSEVGLGWESPPPVVVGFVVAVGFGMLISIVVLWLKFEVQLVGDGEAAAIRVYIGREFPPGGAWRDCMEEIPLHLKFGRAQTLWVGLRRALLCGVMAKAERRECVRKGGRVTSRP